MLNNKFVFISYMPSDFEAAVVGIKQLSYNVYLFRFKPKRKIEFGAGQFFMIHYNNTKRAFSAASSPSNDALEFCIKILDEGELTSHLKNAKVGEAISMSGPFGRFTLSNDNLDKVFIATGTGVGPLRAMIHFLLHSGSKAKINLLFGVRSEGDLIFKDEFANLSEKYPNFSFMYCISQPKTAMKDSFLVKGRVTEHLKRFANSRAEFYLCGKPEMVKEVSNNLREVGVSENQIKTEKW